MKTNEEIRQKVTSSVFYGPTDEVLECWLSLCQSVSFLLSIEHRERAAILAEWIETDAKESESFWHKHAQEYLGVPFEDVEYRNGQI